MKNVIDDDKSRLLSYFIWSMAVLHVVWGIVCDHEIYDCALISAAFYQQQSTGSRSILLQQSSYAIAYHIYHQPPKFWKKNRNFSCL